MPQPLVLIVDDNPENLSVVGELLLPDHAVRVANSGLRALQLARLAPQPDLVLLDVMMPGMDGFAVLRALRADPQTADIPVVLLTALDNADDEERGLQSGAADYITKPVRAGVLLARVALQLAACSARRQLGAERRQMEDTLRQMQADLKAMQDTTLHALRHLLLLRQPAVGRHQQTMQDHLRSLCLALRRDARFGQPLDDRQIDQLMQAASLHDIGMLAVPDHVLGKPGPLDDDERAMMQAHTRVGADALAWAGQAAADVAAWLPWARGIARHHHERWDGLGYPDGLAGDAIPWPARLAALVDAYDGLTSVRPHRPALSHADAAMLIAAERGRQFDPAVTDAFLDCSGDWPAIAQRHG